MIFRQSALLHHAAAKADQTFRMLFFDPVQMPETPVDMFIGIFPDGAGIVMTTSASSSFSCFFESESRRTTPAFSRVAGIHLTAEVDDCEAGPATELRARASANEEASGYTRTPIFEADSPALSASLFCFILMSRLSRFLWFWLFPELKRRYPV